MTNASKPIVSVATVCEKVLVEKDNVHTAVRIVDTVLVPPRPPNLPEGAKPGLQLSALIVLKSGEFVGNGEASLYLRSPTGRSVQLLEPQPMVFRGGEQGVTFVANLLFEISEPGLYWFDLKWQSELLSSFPLMIKPQSEADASLSPDKN